MSIFASYQLLDFGDGRRLEHFGGVTLDRPCSAAERTTKSDPAAWQSADARFDGRREEKGKWTCRRNLPDRWTVAFGPLRFELKRTEFGHLGLFPEQAENWDWIAQTLSAAKKEDAADRLRVRPPLETLPCQGFRRQNNRLLAVPTALTPGPSPVGRARGGRKADELFKVLNLFAYTGGSTLAAAAAGARVTHVDAAKNVVAWARRNAELSGLADAPIRWIAEDAAKFVQRELKRGNRYDAVILDPPSYGHGPQGEVWQLAKHLPKLMAMCGELTAGRAAFLLLTCHTPGYDAPTLAAMMQDVWGKRGRWIAGPLSIPAATGARLPSGVVVKWSSRNLKSEI